MDSSDPMMAQKPPMEAPDAKKAPSGMTVMLPLVSLQMPGEDDKMQSPGVGDPVSVYAEGKIMSINGEQAQVQFDTVNGKPLSAEAAMTANTPEADEDMDKQFASLQSEASQMDGGQS